MDVEAQGRVAVGAPAQKPASVVGLGGGPAVQFRLDDDDDMAGDEVTEEKRRKTSQRDTCHSSGLLGYFMLSIHIESQYF